MDFQNCPDVRLATPEDEDDILRLMKIACEEDAQHAMNEDKVRAVIRLHFDKRGGLIGVIGDPGDLKAYILMVVNEVWYSSEYQLQELSLFVSPEHRRSNFAKQLMAFSKQAAEGLCLDLMIGVLSSERTAAKVRLYQRQFPQRGAYFIYSPQG